MNKYIEKYYNKEFKELQKTLNNDAKFFQYVQKRDIIKLYKQIVCNNLSIKGVRNRTNNRSLTLEVSDGITTKYYTINDGNVLERNFKEYLYDISTYNEFFKEQEEISEEDIIKLIKYNIYRRECIKNAKYYKQNEKFFNL